MLGRLKRAGEVLELKPAIIAGFNSAVVSFRGSIQ
jgi:hypothetical protein